MNKYKVMLVAQIGKSLIVEAPTPEAAEQEAYERFNPFEVTGDESYSHYTYEIHEVQT
jgi:hypothetical protein